MSHELAIESEGCFFVSLARYAIWLDAIDAIDAMRSLPLPIEVLVSLV